MWQREIKIFYLGIHFECFVVAGASYVQWVSEDGNFFGTLLRGIICSGGIKVGE